MKIAIFSPYLGSVNRGAETFVKEISCKFIELGHSVTVYTAQSASGIAAKNVVVDVSLPFWYKLIKKVYDKNKLFRRVADRLHYLVPTVLYQYYFCKSLNRQFPESLKKYDIFYPNNGIWGVRLSNRFARSKSRVIYTGHGGIGVGEEKIVSEVGCYVCLTPEHYLWASKLARKGRLEMIPNGVDVLDFSNNQSSVRCKDDRKVLCVGAFDDFKRQELLIDAASVMSSVSLLFVGRGMRESNLREYAAKCNVDAEFMSVDYLDMPKVYSSCKVFTLPSRCEPFGIVYLEAMASELNLVVPDDPARRFICNDFAEYVNVKDRYEYAAALEQALIKDSNSQGRMYVVNNYSWDVLVLKYNNVIEGLIS